MKKTSTTHKTLYGQLSLTGDANIDKLSINEIDIKVTALNVEILKDQQALSEYRKRYGSTSVVGAIEEERIKRNKELIAKLKTRRAQLVATGAKPVAPSAPKVTPKKPAVTPKPTPKPTVKHAETPKETSKPFEEKAGTPNWLLLGSAAAAAFFILKKDNGTPKTKSTRKPKTRTKRTTRTTHTKRKK